MLQNLRTRVLLPFLAMLLTTSLIAQNQELAEKAKEKYKAGKYKEAASLYNKAIENSPNDARLYLERSRVLINLQQSEQAFNDICKAIKLDPAYQEAYFDRATFYYYLREADKSILDYSSALKYAAHDSTRHHILVNRASSKLLKRDFNGAIEDCKEVLKKDSLNVGALNNLAMSLDGVGRGDETIPILKKIIKIDSTAGYAFMNIGFRLSLIGKYEESLPYFDKALEISPDLAYIYNNRGYSKFMLNRHEDALKDINKSIKMDPSNSYAYKNRGLVYLAQGKKDKACEDWEQAKRLGFAKSYGNEVEELIKANCL